MFELSMKLSLNTIGSCFGWFELKVVIKMTKIISMNNFFNFQFKPSKA